MVYTVLLNDDTVGNIDAENIAIGDMITVSLHNENGMPIEVSGILKEILDEKEN